MPNILTHLCEGHNPDREALWRPAPDGGWLPVTWEQLSATTDDTAMAFELLGLKEQQRVGIFSENRPETIVADLAAYRNRAIPVSIYSTSSDSQLKYIVDDASISILLVGSQQHYDAARRIGLRQIITIDPSIARNPDDDTTMTFAELTDMGHRASAATRAEVRRRTEDATPDDIATLIYTSGTTGEPKGAILTHANFNAALLLHRQRLTSLSPADTSLSFLPLSHIFEKAWTYFCLMSDIRVYVNLDPHKIQEAVATARPTCMCSVPRFWEKVYAAATEKIAGLGAIKRRIATWAIAIGQRRNIDYKRSGRPTPRLLELRYRLADRMVLSGIRRAIGIDRGNIFPTAGAPINPDIVRFLHSCGINIVVGYGLSETTATVTCFPSVGYEIGSVGTTLPTVDIKIGADNEILVKGPTIMSGYFGKPEATAEAFTADGWFRTGDAGRIAPSGALIITDRIKDLFKTSNGKYIAPQAIESRLGCDRYIEQVAVIGDKRKYVTAIIIPAFEAIKDYAHRHKISYRSITELVANEEIRSLFERRINRLQADFAGFERIKKFTLLPRAFTMEAGELTNTLKLRRPVINRHYAAVIEAMYA